MTRNISQTNRDFWFRTVAFAALSISLLACSEPKNDAAKTTSNAAKDGEAHEENEHATDGPLVLTEAQYATAGITVEAASLEPMIAEGAALDVPGQVEHDPRRVAIISPRASGRIERLMFVEGERVDGGQPVAFLEPRVSDRAERPRSVGTTGENPRRHPGC